MNDHENRGSACPELRWKVTSRPGAVIRVEELEMTDDIRRRLTGGTRRYWPAPRIERFRRFWQLPV
jgi:hypothetical protein